MKKKLINLLVLVIICYLFTSSIYILINIDFNGPSGAVGMGFDENNNIVRSIMGLPKTFNTYNGISPIYLLEVIIKILIAFFLIKYLFKREKIQKYKIYKIFITYIIVDYDYI